MKRTPVTIHMQDFPDRFLDVYGRELVCEDVFPVIAACEVFG